MVLRLSLVEHHFTLRVLSSNITALSGIGSCLPSALVHSIRVNDPCTSHLMVATELITAVRRVGETDTSGSPEITTNMYEVLGNKIYFLILCNKTLTYEEYALDHLLVSISTIIHSCKCTYIFFKHTVLDFSYSVKTISALQKPTNMVFLAKLFPQVFSQNGYLYARFKDSLTNRNIIH